MIGSILAMLIASPGASVPQAAPAGSPRSFPLACLYERRGVGMDDAERCAAEVGGVVTLDPAIVAVLAYRRGLASYAVIGKGWFLRRRDGVTRLMYTFEAGPDHFVEGLARAWIDGRLAYVDRRLRVRFRTRYDWGDRFERGRAAVCIGCTVLKVDGGEHSVMTGGRWGVIDRRGREVVPVIHDQRAFAALPVSR
ncbi:hypothetical protein [Sphingomonas montana]|uniref:hypothetical protein n=1 Tax=Sphingomonas montana TaxID=1843236 RepID=UPI00096F4B0B|nr:hypothetical protein [Sphingomonas montana]